MEKGEEKRKGKNRGMALTYEGMHSFCIRFCSFLSFFTALSLKVLFGTIGLTPTKTQKNGVLFCAKLFRGGGPCVHDAGARSFFLFLCGGGAARRSPRIARVWQSDVHGNGMSLSEKDAHPHYVICYAIVVAVLFLFGAHASLSQSHRLGDCLMKSTRATSPWTKPLIRTFGTLQRRGMDVRAHSASEGRQFFLEMRIRTHFLILSS